MSQKVNVAPLGLYTDPNQDTLPDGALIEASNVTIRRENVVEPRNGFPSVLVAGDGSPPTEVVRCGRHYNGGYYTGGCAGATAAWTTGPDVWTLRKAPFTSVELFNPPQYWPYRFAEAHRNLVYTTREGPHFTYQGAAGARYGLPAALSGQMAFASGTANWISGNQAVAYRLVYRRTRANGDVIRSAPSGRMIVRLEGGWAGPVTVTAPLTSELVAGDFVELYRSNPVDISSVPDALPDDEQVLQITHAVTSADVSNGYAVLVDDKTDPSDYGAALYTNATQEGLMQENARAPRCAELAFFNGALFHANVLTRETLQVTMTGVGGGHGAADTAGVGVRSATPDDTVGTTPFVPVDGTAYTSGDNYFYVHGCPLRDPALPDPGNTQDNTCALWTVGARVESSEAGFPANSLITGVASYVDTPQPGVTRWKVSISTTLTASSTTAAITCSDVVRVGGTSYYAGVGNDVANKIFDITDDYTDARNNAQFCLQNLAYVINRSHATLQADVGAEGVGYMAVLLVTERVPGGGTFYVTGSSGTAWDPPLVGATSDTTIASKSDNWPDGLFWSKWNEPEAVPPVNYTRVGTQARRIVALAATRDSLFVFKEDGIWRLTGTVPNIAIEPFDASFIALGPQFVAEFEGDVIAWTNKGLVRINDSGVVVISEPIYSDLRTKQDAALKVLFAGGAAFYPGFVATHPNDRLCVLGLPADGTLNDDRAEKCYVYCATTGAWSTWTLTPRTMWFNPTQAALELGSDASTSYDVKREVRPATSGTFLHDRIYQTTLTVTTATTQADGTLYCVISVGSTGYSPVVGDAWVRSGVIYHVVSVDSATKCYLDRAGLVAQNTFAAYRAFTSAVEWKADAAGNPGSWKHFREGALLLEDVYALDRLAVSTRTDIDTTAVSQTLSPTHVVATRAARPSRFLIPRQHQRCDKLRTKMAITQALAEWKLGGLSLVLEGGSERQRRTA